MSGAHSSACRFDPAPPLSRGSSDSPSGCEERQDRFVGQCIRRASKHHLGGISKRWMKGVWLGVLACGVLVVGVGPAVSSALAASTPTVDLGQASTYAVLSGASVGNTVSAPGAAYTTLRGDLGVMAAGAQPTGFPPGVVTGTTRVGTTVTQAYADLGTAYDGVAARTAGTAPSSPER